MLVRVLRSDAAHASGQHDGFVVTAHFSIDTGFISTEVAGQIGPAEFIVECRTANGTFQHDLQRRGNALRLAVFVFLPGLLEAGNIQI